MQARGLERWGAALSFLAGAIHLLVAPGHAEEWWAYGLFFVAAAALQAALALVLLTRGIEGWGGWTAVKGRVYGAGIVLTAAILAVWALSRTVGVGVGPEAGRETAGPLDLMATAAELALVAVLARLLALARRGDGPPAA